MKYVAIFLAWLLCIAGAHAQVISLFNVDATSFPLMKAKFLALDTAGVQQRPGIADLSLTENGSARTITNLSCPSSVSVRALSAVLVTDVSGSMSSSISVGAISRIDLAKAAARAWVNALPLGASECAITSFDHINYLNQDFTKDRAKLLQSIAALSPQGGTDYDIALNTPMAGGLQVSQRGLRQRVVIMVTDGQPYQDPNTAAIIAEANKQNCIIYCITLGMPSPQSLRDIAAQTGGQCYDNVTTVTEAEDVCRTILQMALGGRLCTIEWLGVPVCQPDDVNVLLSWKGISIQAWCSAPSNSILSLEVKPISIVFGQLMPGTVKDTIITLTAKNADFVVTSIVRAFGSAAFTVVNTTFPLTITKGSSNSLTLRYSPVDSSMNFASIDIQTDECLFSMSASGGFPGKRMNSATLKLTHPIGGDTFVVGSDTVITWKGVSPSDMVELEYSVDGGRVWTTITDAATGLQYVWKNIPRPTSTQCKIRVSQRNNGQGAKDRGFLLHTLTGHSSEVRDVAWSPDGSQVATASWDNTARIWDVATGTMVYTLVGHSSGVADVAWRPDAGRVVTASSDGTSIVWDATSGSLVNRFIGHENVVYAATWSPDGRKVGTASYDGNAKIWDAITGTELFTIAGNTGWVSAVNWSPDGSKIATTDVGTTKIWDENTRLLLSTLTIGSTTWRSVAWSPEGDRVATTGRECTASVWDATTGELLLSIGPGATSTGVSWSPDGKRIVSAGADGYAKIWDANSGALLFALTQQWGPINVAAWSPDGSKVAVAGYAREVIIWNSITGKVLLTLRGHSDEINAVTWSPDGRSVASASFDGTAKVWYLDAELIQEDVSSEFNVVMPSPLSTDVNMQLCMVGGVKDSVVADGIRNTGTYPYRTDSVFFAGADASSFRLVSGIPPFHVAASAARPLEFRFAPKRLGLHTADIVIVTQADTLVQKIQGIGVASSLAIVNNIIDFGKVLVGASKDTLNAVTITNVGSAPLTITATRHAGPNDVDFTSLAGGNTFTLNAGDTARVDLRFSPSARGRTSGRLLFDYNGFGSPAMVQLFAEGVGPDTARATIAIDNIDAQAGEKVNLVLKLDKQSGLQLANSPTDWFARIHYNPTVLFNELTNNVCVSVSNDSCTIELTGTYNPTSAMLASIPCVATLGTTDRATLDIETFVWTNGDVESETQLIDGVITVTGICEDGGVRLFIPAGSSTSLASRPNPVNDELRIDYGLVSETSVTLTLASSTGQIARTIVSNKPHSAGRYDVVQDVSSLSSGVYYLTLRTNARTLTSRVDIVK